MPLQSATAAHPNARSSTLPPQFQSNVFGQQNPPSVINIPSSMQPSDSNRRHQGYHHNDTSHSTNNILNRSGSVSLSLALAVGGICLAIFSIWQCLEAFLALPIIRSSWTKVGLVLMGLLYVGGFFVGLWSIMSAILNVMPDHHTNTAPKSKWYWILMFRRISIIGNLVAFIVFVLLMVIVSVSIEYWEIFAVLCCYGCCFVCIFSTLLNEIMRIKVKMAVMRGASADDASQQPGAQRRAVSGAQQQRHSAMQSSTGAPASADDWLDAELPPSWERKLDPITGRYFYVDHINRRTTWVHPMLDEEVMTSLASYAVPPSTADRAPGASGASSTMGNFYRQPENPDSKEVAAYTSAYTTTNAPPLVDNNSLYDNDEVDGINYNAPDHVNNSSDDDNAFHARP